MASKELKAWLRAVDAWSNQVDICADAFLDKSPDYEKESKIEEDLFLKMVERFEDFENSRIMRHLV